MATKPIVILLVQLLLCCSGELVLYVQSNGNETACPPGTDPTVNCRLLSEYATDPFLSLDLNTTFVFLPGEHILNTELSLNSSVNGVNNLKLRSETNSNAVITCSQNGMFSFHSLDHVDVSSLRFLSCEFYAVSVGNAVFRLSRFEYSHRSFFSLIFEEGSSTIEHCSLEDNAAPLIVVVNGLLYFRGNNVSRNSDAWIVLVENSNATLTDNQFASNEHTVGILVLGSTLWFTGKNVFSDNSGAHGVLFCFNCTLVLDGNTTFANNTGRIAGVLGGIFLDLFVIGDAHFVGNTGSNGGALVSQSSQLYFSGNARFDGNFADYGGAIYLISSTISFLGDANVAFSENLAANGGAMFLTSGSSLYFPGKSSASVTFERNRAARGGAIFIQDYDALSYCQLNDNIPFGPVQVCSFLFDDSAIESSSPDNLYFYAINAEEAGSAIYGGAIDFCISSSEGFSATDQFFQRVVFGNTSGFDFTSSVISSNPFMLYACDGNALNCTDCSISRTVFPGATVNVTVVALGQLNGTVPATILANTTGLEIGKLEGKQGIPRGCSDLSYTVYAPPGSATLELFAVGPCMSQIWTKTHS